MHPPIDSYRFTLARASRIAHRLERSFQRTVPDCTVATRARKLERAVDLRIGPRGASDAEALWVENLDVGKLARDAAIDRLADVIRVWIEPEPVARDRSAGRGARAVATASR